MKKILKNLLLLTLLINLFSVPFKANAVDNNFLGDASINKTKCDLKMNQRRLWIDHVS